MPPAQRVGGADPSASVADLGPPIVPRDTPLDQIAHDDLWKQLLARMNQPGLLAMSGPLTLANLAGIQGNRLKLSAQPVIVKLLSEPRRQGQLLAALTKLLDRPVELEWIEASGPAAAPNGNGPANGGGSGRAASSSPAPAPRLSQQEVNQVMADSTVRQVMDIFNASLVGVDRR